MKKTRQNQTKLVIILDQVIEDKALGAMENIMYKHLYACQDEMKRKFDTLVKDMSLSVKHAVKDALDLQLPIKK